MLLVGCLFPEPPDFQAPPMTAPQLWAPNYPTTQILTAVSGETLDFNVRVRSEDDGHEIWAFFYLNYLIAMPGREREQPTGFRPLDPSTYDDMNRQLRMQWTTPQRAPGSCVQLTLLASHRSNFDEKNFPVRDDDVGMLTWWVVIDGANTSIGQCPSSVGAN